MKQFYVCVKTHITSNHSLSTSVNRCLPQAIEGCSAAKLRVVKTIRLSMAKAEELLRQHKNLKVIHLVRDPRGMFASQYKTRLLKPQSFQSQFQDMCSRMVNDSVTTKRLIKSGNKNVKLLRYEDLANDPVKKVKELYKFIDQPLTEAVRKYVIENTSSNLKDGCLYCTRRGNSTLTASKWRMRIGSVFLRLINRFCRRVYSIYGYDYVDNVGTIRNLNKPVMSESIPLLV